MRRIILPGLIALQAVGRAMLPLVRNLDCRDPGSPRRAAASFDSLENAKFRVTFSLLLPSLLGASDND